MTLVIRNLGVEAAHGRERLPVLDGVSFEVAAGELVAVVGRSGCGKTTLLRCAAGLSRPSRGEALLDGRAVQGPPSGAATVFQNYGASLLPWRTLLGNVLFALECAGAPRRSRSASARQALAAVGLGDFAGRYPWELSGGMQQRVALARALASGARMLFMDEPFASVDALSRAELQDLLLRVLAERAPAVLFVTHDVDEAVYLADRVLVLAGSPAGLAGSVGVELPHPRSQLSTRADPVFSRCRARVFELLAGAA